MIEILLASVLIGKVQISPTVVQLDYLTSDQEIITILDNINNSQNSQSDFCDDF